MKRSLLSLGLLFVLHLYFITTSAQVRDIGCLLMCENGLIPGRCQCNPAPRISCSLHCDNGFVPGECRCRPVNAGIKQSPRLSCMVDCPPGTRLVESECRCENVAGRPISQRSPCSGVVCSRFQQCRDVNGRGICTSSFFHNIFNWPRRPVSDSQTERCQQRVERGRCRAAMRRYYYDSRTRRCVSFYYGGCGGNQNNFRTLSECRATCSQTFSSPGL